eukprot:3035774-Rhodomonas_salina.5
MLLCGGAARVAHLTQLFVFFFCLFVYSFQPCHWTFSVLRAAANRAEGFNLSVCSCIRVLECESSLLSGLKGGGRIGGAVLCCCPGACAGGFVVLCCAGGGGVLCCCFPGACGGRGGAESPPFAGTNLGVFGGAGPGTLRTAAVALSGASARSNALNRCTLSSSAASKQQPVHAQPLNCETAPSSVTTPKVMV